MLFEAFAENAARIEAEEADLETTALLADLLSAADEELPIVTRFVLGRVFPAWTSETLDVGPALLYEAIARSAGPNVSASDVETQLAAIGEIGAVAQQYEFGGQRGLSAFGSGSEPDAFTVTAIDETLRSIAAADGRGSTETKREALFGLFNSCTPKEARFLARIVLSEMRIGVGEGTVRDAIAEAFDVPVAAVARALQVTNDYGKVALVARSTGTDGLAELQLSIGRPVQAMLAQTGSAAEAIDAWGETAVETKFDGARLQVHYDGASTSLFSRNMEDVTDALPEIVDAVAAAANAPCILDGEVVAVDDEGDPLAFQAVLRRFRRKHDVERMRQQVTLQLHAFDCLHCDGEDLLDEPLATRHERLETVLDVTAMVSKMTRSAALEEIAAIEADALAAGHEGIMLKDPASTYTPGDRGKHWLKRKPDVETLDLVVTGAEWGEGRRGNFLGTFLLSVRTDDGYETIGKVATGITDETLAELTARLEPEIVSESGTDVQIRPAVVFEVGYEEIQRSPTYSSGYALRFPRFVAVREDKRPAEADTLDRVDALADR
ncbi:MAG: ATP-dependent DNA ligase LigA [Halobacteriota archaeon]